MNRAFVFEIAQLFSITTLILSLLLAQSSNLFLYSVLLPYTVSSLFYQKFLGEGKSNEQLLKEASAIYTAVYGKAVIKESLALQFAWKIAGPQLCEIFANKRGGYICMARENIGFLLRR